MKSNKIRNTKDIRSIYASQHETKIPKDWDIHHIDFDRNNNDYHNLIALPSDLHHRLHVAYDNCKPYLKYYTVGDIGLYTNYDTERTEFIHTIYEYISVIQECVPYMNRGDVELKRKYGVNYGYNDNNFDM